MTNNKKNGQFSRRCMSAVLALILVLGLAACGNTEKEPLRAPETEVIPTVAIETTYGTLAFPEDLFGNLRHTEVTEGKIAMEIFSMVSGEGEKELFRILYADAMMGEHMGYLTTDSGEISVSYLLCEYEDTHFANEDERKLYSAMMDAFSVVINSIYEDARFSENKAMEPVGIQNAQLRYWKAELPDNVRFTETEENGNYRVDFYGEVSGERIDLYTIALGNVEAETMLGLYTVNGEQKPVMIQTYNMDEYAVWPDEERTVIYQMMESVNLVIQAIVADENFAEMTADPGVG